MKKVLIISIIITLLTGMAMGESLFSPNTRTTKSLFSDISPRASQVGDIVTIIIEPTTEIKSNNSYSEKKSLSLAASFIPLNLLGTSAFTPLDISRDNSTGNSQTGQRQFTMTTTMSATIQEVLPNGNFIIMGQQEIFVGEKKQLLQFSGIVRPGDITQSNNISSTKIANASLSIQGELGEIQEKKGIFTRILDWIF